VVATELLEEMLVKMVSQTLAVVLEPVMTKLVGLE
jgi:hypothetical protein